MTLCLCHETHLLLEPGDIPVKVDTVLPGSVGILPNPLGQFAKVLSLLGLQICFQQQLSMECPLKVLHIHQHHHHCILAHWRACQGSVCRVCKVLPSLSGSMFMNLA